MTESILSQSFNLSGGCVYSTVLWFTLRSCATSALSSFGERRVVRDSLLPDSPRLDPDRKADPSAQEHQL